jgi:hypothetical protein
MYDFIYLGWVDLLYKGKSAGRVCITCEFEGNFGKPMGLGGMPMGTGVGVGGMKKEF